MTAIVEICENQMKIKGVFSPLLVEQVLLTWHYQLVRRTQIGAEEQIIAHFPSSCLQSYRTCPAKKHLFTKLPSGY